MVLLAKSWKMLVRVCVCLCVVSAGHRHRPNLRQSPGGAGLQGALCRCRVARGMHLPFSKILHFPTLCCDRGALAHSELESGVSFPLPETGSM